MATFHEENIQHILLHPSKLQSIQNLLSATPIPLSVSLSHSPTTATMGSAASDYVAEFGFAKLQGKDFEYYMHSCSILLGRNSKTSLVEVDLTSLGGGMKISHHHARIFYDFTRRCFSLEVLGKNGCYVEEKHHTAWHHHKILDEIMKSRYTSKNIAIEELSET